MHIIKFSVFASVVGIILVAWLIFEFRERARRGRISDCIIEWTECKKKFDSWLMDDRTRSMHYPEGQWFLRAELRALEKLLREQRGEADPEDKETFRRRSLLIDESIVAREPYPFQRA